MPVADPATGEILFDEGHVLTGAECPELDAIGVAEVSVKLDSGDVIRVFTNRMCDMQPLCGLRSQGVLRHQGAGALRRAAGAAGASTSGEELMEQCRLHADDLVPKHIIVDDILASINYMNALAHGRGQQG